MSEAVNEAPGTCGLELKIARLRERLKQYELAAKLGIAPSQLCNIEAGRREPVSELLQQL